MSREKQGQEFHDPFSRPLSETPFRALRAKRRTSGLWWTLELGRLVSSLLVGPAAGLGVHTPLFPPRETTTKQKKEGFALLEFIRARFPLFLHKKTRNTNEKEEENKLEKLHFRHFFHFAKSFSNMVLVFAKIFCQNFFDGPNLPAQAG